MRRGWLSVETKDYLQRGIHKGDRKLPFFVQL